MGQSEPLGEKDRARLNLDASGTQVAFLGAEGKPIGTLIVGRRYFKREVENPDKAIPMAASSPSPRRRGRPTWSAIRSPRRR